MLVKLAGPRGCLAIKRRRSRATHRSRQRYQIPRRPNPQPSRRLIHILRAHDALCATEPACPGCSARRSNLVKSWIDSCLDDFARKRFWSSPPCLLIVVAARPIGFAGSIFLSRIFLAAFLKNQVADRKIRDRKMQAMSLKPSRSQFCLWPATNGGEAIWQNHGGQNHEVGIRRDESTNVGAGHVRNSQTASRAHILIHNI